MLFRSHEEGRRAQTKSYMCLFRSGEDGGIPIILYKYSPTRAGDNAVEFLQEFNGYLMCDLNSYALHKL